MSASHDFDKGDAGREERSSRAHAREDCEHWRVGNLLHPASNAIALHSDSYSHHFRLTALSKPFNGRLAQVELTTGRLHVRRAKNGSPSVHPMQGDEIRALRRLQREQGLSSHVFMSERDGPMTPKAFHALFGRIGSRAKMQFPIHPHMLRHGCGYALANAGHDTRALQAWLGHRNIQHTVRYTELAPDRFKNFWRD